MWSGNMEEEMARIREVVIKYPFVAVVRYASQPKNQAHQPSTASELPAAVSQTPQSNTPALTGIFFSLFSL